MTNEQFTQLNSDLLNGNLSDYRAAIKKLGKRDLVAYLYITSIETGAINEDMEQVHKQILIALANKE